MCECRNKSFNYQLLIIILDRTKKKKPSEKVLFPRSLSISLPRKKGWCGVEGNNELGFLITGFAFRGVESKNEEPNECHR